MCLKVIVQRKIKGSDGLYEKGVNLIKCITHYKTVMEFDNRDFNADKVKLYEEVRKLMAKIYEETLLCLVQCMLP